MKNNPGLSVFFLVLSLVLFSGCGNDSITKEKIDPARIIPREKMIRLMADMNLTESMLKLKQNKLARDSVKKIAAQTYDSLYLYYGITPRQFDENMEYYQENMDDFQAMIDSVLVVLTKQKDSIANQKNLPDTLKEPGK